MSTKVKKWLLFVFSVLLVAGIVITSAAINAGIKKEHQRQCINPFMSNVKGVSLNLNEAVNAKDDKIFRQAMTNAMTYFNSLTEVEIRSIYWAYPEDLELLQNTITAAHAAYSALCEKHPSQSELFRSERAMLTRYAAAFDELLHALVQDDAEYDPMVLDPKVYDPDALSEMIQTFYSQLLWGTK